MLVATNTHCELSEFHFQGLHPLELAFVISILDQSRNSQKIYKYFSFANHGRSADDEPLGPTYQISKEKVKSLAIDFIPLEVSLKDTIESLKEKNFINL